MEQNKIYRKETCPWGKKAIHLLNEKNISYEDHIFSSKEEEESFKEKYKVKTTPQIFLDGLRVGGYTDLAKKYNIEVEDTTSYIPVISVFATAAALSFVLSLGLVGFMGFALCILACLKLMDLASFAEGFQKYDLVTKKVGVYAKAYPFLELIIGLGFLGRIYPSIIGAVSLIVGILGCISIYKAVYIEKKDLNCACVGGNSNVPLGAVSFAENAMMVLMGLLFIMPAM